MVSMDCGSHQTFTCSVTVGAGCTISELSGIDLTHYTGLEAAMNARINTADTSGFTSSSTINIAGFATADNGGTIQCIELANNRVQGVATVSVGE